VKLNKIKYLILTIILGFTAFFSVQEKKETVIRAALDIGSGATKLKVAEVNLKTQKIEKILANESFSVQYQEELEKSPDGTFTPKVMEEGIEALKKCKEIALRHGADKVVGIATASFRKAGNADSFAQKIENETGVSIYIIDQELEGILGFNATAAHLAEEPQDVIAWDIGGGSYQFSALDENKNIVVHRGLDASIPFKNRVIKQIKKSDPARVSTPNPLSRAEMEKAEEAARLLSEKVDHLFKQKIAHPNAKIVGIGNIFAYGIHPLVGKKHSFTQKELEERVQSLQGKTDEELGAGPYANVAVTNPMLILGFMQKLGIEEMEIADINNADGALVHAPFWATTG